MLRFTIRDVLWLTVVVAVLVAWLLSASRFQNQLAHSNSELRRMESEFRQIEEQNRRLHAEAAATARLEFGPFPGEPDANAPGSRSAGLP
jgi:cell division protein FtsB